jgi:hypothetical protein
MVGRPIVFMAVAAVAVPMHMMHGRACEQDREGKKSEQMRAMLSEEKERAHCEKSKQDPSRVEARPAPLPRSVLFVFHHQLRLFPTETRQLLEV